MSVRLNSPLILTLKVVRWIGLVLRFLTIFKLFWKMKSSHYCLCIKLCREYFRKHRNLHHQTIITLPHQSKLFKHLVTYSQVWYIIGIVSSSPTHFHSEKIGLIRVTYNPPVSIRVDKYFVTYTQVWYIIGIVSSSPTDFQTEK